MEAARSPASSPCSPQAGSATHCSGSLRPISSAGLDSVLASVSTQSGSTDESAHSVPLPGAVKPAIYIQRNRRNIPQQQSIPPPVAQPRKNQHFTSGWINKPDNVAYNAISILRNSTSTGSESSIPWVAFSISSRAKKGRSACFSNVIRRCSNPEKLSV
ncbi:hypothetical protein Nepgr_008006 [Nepenthes gracilis]|uniref:Uncharacterized protein n=1 Tax=Nepenthes gracilis TaxID=150966 RepID=A0AAD3XJ18_NEPGR|nr:hypothetical protein Nepgr_008006 [Nepenthes gracilis]